MSVQRSGYAGNRAPPVTHIDVDDQKITASSGQSVSAATESGGESAPQSEKVRLT